MKTQPPRIVQPKEIPAFRGEWPFKRFVAELARRMGIGWHGGYHHVYQVPGLQFRRVNKRVVFVRRGGGQ